jgi:hypothetical protein
LDEIRLMLRIQERARKFLVDGFGADGVEILNKFTGPDLPQGLSDREIAKQIRDLVGEASLELAFYMLAS